MKIGFSRNDMTPQLGIELSGYYNVRKSDSVHDPLYMNTLVVDDEGKRAVVIVMDTLGCYHMDVADMWVRSAMEASGAEYEACFICHTHTHTGPQFKSYRHPGYPENEQFVADVVKESVAAAVKDLAEVTDVQAGEMETQGIMFVRRMQMKDGHYQTWSSFLNPEILRPASKADETLRMVKILREGREELVLINAQNHPDLIGGTSISADFPGLLRRFFEIQHPGTKAIYYNGCEGQMTPVDYINDSIPHVKGFPRCAYYAEMLHGFCEELYKNLETVKYENGEAVLDGKKAEAGLSYGIKTTRCEAKYYPERVEEAKHIIELHEAGRDDEISPEKRYLRMGITAEAYHIVNLAENEIKYQDLPVRKVSFLGIAFVGMPGEPFCEIGREVRAASKYPVTSVCCQTHIVYGYYPDAAAFDQDGYEPRNSRLKKGVGENLIATAKELLK